MFGLETEFADVRIGDSTAELVVILAAIQRTLDVLPQGREMDIVPEIDASDVEEPLLGAPRSSVASGAGLEPGRSQD